MFLLEMQKNMLRQCLQRNLLKPTGRFVMPEFFDKIYDSWKDKQLEKYEEIFPLILPYLIEINSVLDLGIGKAWFESFLLSKGIKFPRVLGVDISEEAVSPQ